jgi:hypothetical protein
MMKSYNKILNNFSLKIMSYNVGSYDAPAKKPQRFLDQESAISANPLIGSEADRIKQQIEKTLNTN